MKLKWPGPTHGVTQSMLNKFLCDPYEFYLYAALGLQVPRTYKPNLAWGDTFHVGLEHLLDNVYEADRNQRIKNAQEAMHEHLQREYPLAERTFHSSCCEMLNLYKDEWTYDYKCETEITFNIPYLLITPTSRYDIRLIGKYDVVAYHPDLYSPENPADMSVLDTYPTKRVRSVPAMIGEHKCKKYVDTAQTREEVPIDLQCNMYCLTSGSQKVMFDTIKIPDVQYSLPEKRNLESIPNYVKRIYHDHVYKDYPIKRNKHLWLDQVPITITTEMQNIFAEETLDPILTRLCLWYDYISSDEFDPKNPKYNHIFYKTPIRHFNARKTEEYKTEYHNLTVGNWTLSELEPVGSYNSELDL
jgi:hypothetical protein